MEPAGFCFLHVTVEAGLLQRYIQSALIKLVITLKQNTLVITSIDVAVETTETAGVLIMVIECTNFLN